MLPSELNLDWNDLWTKLLNFSNIIPSLKNWIVKGNQRFKSTYFSVFSTSVILILGKSNMQHFTLHMYVFMKVDKNYKLLWWQTTCIIRLLMIYNFIIYYNNWSYNNPMQLNSPEFHSNNNESYHCIVLQSIFLPLCLKYFWSDDYSSSSTKQQPSSRRQIGNLFMNRVK